MVEVFLGMRIYVHIVVIIIMGLAGIISFSGWLAANVACVDYSQARFKKGDMVMFEIGDIGRVVKRVGTNEGPVWNLIPIFEYEVRIRGSYKQTFQEWELEHVEK